MTRTEKADEGRRIASDKVDEWLALRQELSALEAAEHTHITDVLGRVWTWRDGDLYRHDSMAWTKGMVLNPDLQGPTRYALENPNRQWCDICKAAAQ